MSLGCVKAFSILHNHTRRDVTHKVHNSISHLNSNYAICLKDPVDISQMLFGNRLLLATIAWGNRQPYLDYLKEVNNITFIRLSFLVDKMFYFFIIVHARTRTRYRGCSPIS